MVSFVIPAHNEELLLGRTLDALREAAKTEGEPYEIVVADDSSSDRTATVARDRGARVVEACYRHIAATRNAGARAAKGERLVFVDADTLVHGALLRAAFEALRAGAVGGGCVFQFDGSLPLHAKALMPLIHHTSRAARIAAGCFLFCERRVFEAVGGFDESLFGGEEIAFSRALGRMGSFVVLRESVLTSGRKLRAYSGGEILRLVALLAWRGHEMTRSREGLDLWYGPRRDDSEADKITINSQGTANARGA